MVGHQSMSRCVNQCVVAAVESCAGKENKWLDGWIEYLLLVHNGGALVLGPFAHLSCGLGLPVFMHREDLL